MNRNNLASKATKNTSRKANLAKAVNNRAIRDLTDQKCSRRGTRIIRIEGATGGGEKKNTHLLDESQDTDKRPPRADA